MKENDLLKTHGLLKKYDLINDSRLAAFYSGFSGLIYIFFILIGYFISGQQFIFSHSLFTTPFIYMIGSTIICYILFYYIHSLIKLLISKLLHLKMKWVQNKLIPYISSNDDIIEKHKYFITCLSPNIIILILLIPIIIIVYIFAFNWFWLPWIILIENIASMVGDIIILMMIRKYKDCYVLDTRELIKVYIPKDEIQDAKDNEMQYYTLKAQRKIDKRQKRNNYFNQRVERNRKLYEERKKEFENKNKKQIDDVDEQDLDDLSKLDM